LCLPQPGSTNSTMSTRWADIADEEPNIFLTVRIGGKSSHISMERNSTASELNVWTEKTEGLPRDSFVLSDEGGYLKRQRVLETIAPPRDLLLTKRVVDGVPRGLVLRRCGAPLFGKKCQNR
jgi:hypothetical protein